MKNFINRASVGAKKTNNFIKKVTMLICGILVLNTAQVWAVDPTYHLSATTSVENGKKYVFKESSNNYVLTNEISSGKLSATSTFSTTNLVGNEAYIWELESTTGGFFLKNVALSQYLWNAETSGANLGIAASPTARNVWAISFSEGTATISCIANDRMIGNNSSNMYKAYSSPANSYPHLFYVYRVDADATYSVVWKSDGTTVHTDASVTNGSTISTPSNPSVPSGCTGATFVGWTATENYSHATNAPADLFNGTSPEITADITFYAVFAEED